MLDELLLTKEIRKWSEEVLETSCVKHNNLPACPFAKNSWDKEKVKCVLGKGGLWEDIVTYIENFDDAYDVVIYCGTDYEDITAEEVEERIMLLNEFAVPRNLWIMGSHPDTEIPHAADQEHFEPISDEDYYQIFIQRLDVLVKASDSIEAKGYYQNYINKDFLSLVKSRKNKWQEWIKQK
tara:strand:+ start:164 stop:706 length:543 start_codon:yes stop_codon:yes gene_type:complete